MSNQNKIDAIPKTLWELLKLNNTNYNIENALSHKSGGAWHSISSSELFELVRSTALGLKSIGVQKGDRIALLSENSPQWVICDHAITSIGAITVPLYITQIALQIEFIIKNSGAKIFFISSKILFDKVSQILNNLNLEHIIIFEDFASGNNFQTIFDLRSKGLVLQNNNPNLYDELRRDVTEDSVASIIYTSGTTGEPKGVVLTHKNLASNAVDASGVIHWENFDSSIALSFLPLSHIFERTIINMYLYRGIPIYFAESIEQLASNLQELKPNMFTTVPRMLEKVYDKILMKGSELHGIKKILFDWSIKIAKNYNHNEGNNFLYNIKRKIAHKIVFSKWQAALGGRIKFIITGGAALPARLATIFMAADIQLLQGYGLTETSPVIAVNRLENNKLGSVGKLIANVEVKIADDGEIVTRGPNVMVGYYNNPEATNKVLSDGWFSTGDIGKLDKDGYLFITDRKKDLFKSSAGKTIFPSAIESILSANRFVEFAVVTGENRKFCIALLVPNQINLKDWAQKENIEYKSLKDILQNQKLISIYDEHIKKVNDSINTWEQIVKYILINEEVSIITDDLTPTLKVRRKKIEERFKNKIEDIYTEYEHLHDVHHH